jgi:drug/metabolite transporter (DMT)-like permease
MAPYCDASTQGSVGSSVAIAPSVRQRRTVTGGGAALISLFLIGSAAPVTALIRDIPVLIGQGLRYALAAVILIVFLTSTSRLRTLRPAARDLFRIVLLGTVGVAGFTFSYATATRYADPALVGATVAATPVLLALIGPLQRRRRPAVGVVVGALLVAAGTALTTGAGSTGPLGLALALAALGCELAFTLFAVRLIARYGTLATTLYAVVTGGIVLLVAGLIIDGPRHVNVTAAPPQELLSLLYLALLVSIGANLAWYTALPRIGPDRAGLFYAFVPIGALVAGLILGTSSPGAWEIAGLAVMITGLVVGLRLGRPDQSGSTSTVT